MFRRTLVALALIAVLAVVTGVGAGGGTAAAKPKKHEPCKLFTRKQIENAVSPQANLVSLGRYPASNIYGSGIPKGTNCGYLWADSVLDTQPGNPTGACGFDSLGRYSNYSPGYGWIVSYGDSGRQWKRLKHTQATQPRAPDPNGRNGQTEHKISLGHHAKAFYVKDPGYCNATAPDLFAYTLYVYTRHHNLLAIFLWPSKLDQETALAVSKLGHHF